MKHPRLFLSIVALVALAAIAGCEKPKNAATGASESRGTRTAERGKQKQSAKDADKSAEDEAIEFHNNLYALLGAANKPLEKIAKEVAEAIDAANHDYDSDRTRWRSLISSELGGSFAKISGYNLEAPDAFGSEDREFFNTRLKTVRDSVREIIAAIKELEKYYDAEDYKDDWFKKVYMTAPHIDALIATIRSNSDPLRDRVDEITDEIDARNVAKIPVGQWVLNMRNFMKKYRTLTACLLRDEFSDPSYGTGITPEQRRSRISSAEKWLAKAETIITELDVLAAEQRDVTIGGFEESRYEKIYREFYAQYDESKIVTRRIMRDLREKGSMYDENNVTGNQRDIAGKLSEFTKLWNEKGRGGK